jgi:hypothetical protein
MRAPPPRPYVRGMQPERNTSKHVIATAALAVALAVPVGSASAGTDTARTAPIQWTTAQLQQLADAYSAKHPGWRAPHGARVRLSPAQLTWTSENLNALATAYGALHPGWTRPAPAE